MSEAARRLDVSGLDPSAVPSWMRRQTPEARLHNVPGLSREAIAWRTIGTHVAFSIDLVNHTREPTAPAHLIVEAAHLGAFVPGVRVARIAVGPVSPGEQRRVVFRVAPEALPSSMKLAMIIRGYAPHVGDRELDLIAAAEWAGNINVWFDVAPKKAVEVHRALDVSVTAHRSVAMGVLLPPDRSPFNVALNATGRGWAAELVRVHRWLSILVVGAPEAGERAIINLLVTRRSDSRLVPVDFSFRSVEGPSERLGCIRV